MYLFLTSLHEFLFYMKFCKLKNYFFKKAKSILKSLKFSKDKYTILSEIYFVSRICFPFLKIPSRFFEKLKKHKKFYRFTDFTVLRWHILSSKK
jgi:hypothetical protein